MDIWQSVKNKVSPIALRGDMIRVVENQEQVATNSLVDSLEEQLQLEQLLEQSKPGYPEKSESLHYLLSTPFRYPPLIHGSRFGSRFENSLFYASKYLETAFCETAFYRFYFWLGMKDKPASGKFTTEHTVFTTPYYSTKGFKLQHSPFSEFEDELTNPSHYQTTQQLGKELRSQGIEIIEYLSARDPNKGINVALFTPQALVLKKPKDQQQWLCETTAEKVSFSSKTGVYFSFHLDIFLVDSMFPMPAA